MENIKYVAEQLLDLIIFPNTQQMTSNKDLLNLTVGQSECERMLDCYMGF
jgi:hypothetical protein